MRDAQRHDDVNEGEVSLFHLLHKNGTRTLFLGVNVDVNVNTTDATAGATALLLPAQNTHTLHDPIRDTEHARWRR